MHGWEVIHTQKDSAFGQWFCLALEHGTAYTAWILLLLSKLHRRGGGFASTLHEHEIYIYICKTCESWGLHHNNHHDFNARLVAICIPLSLLMACHYSSHPPMPAFIPASPTTPRPHLLLTGVGFHSTSRTNFIACAILVICPVTLSACSSLFASLSA